MLKATLRVRIFASLCVCVLAAAQAQPSNADGIPIPDGYQIVAMSPTVSQKSNAPSSTQAPQASEAPPAPEASVPEGYKVVALSKPDAEQKPAVAEQKPAATEQKPATEEAQASSMKMHLLEDENAALKAQLAATQQQAMQLAAQQQAQLAAAQQEAQKAQKIAAEEQTELTAARLEAKQSQQARKLKRMLSRKPEFANGMVPTPAEASMERSLANIRASQQRSQQASKAVTQTNQETPPQPEVVHRPPHQTETVIHHKMAHAAKASSSPTVHMATSAQHNVASQPTTVAAPAKPSTAHAVQEAPHTVAASAVAASKTVQHESSPAFNVVPDKDVVVDNAIGMVEGPLVQNGPESQAFVPANKLGNVLSIDCLDTMLRNGASAHPCRKQYVEVPSVQAETLVHHKLRRR